MLVVSIAGGDGSPSGDRSEKSFLFSPLQRGRGYLPQVGYLAQGSIPRL